MTDRVLRWQGVDKAVAGGASLLPMNIQAQYFWWFTDKGRQENNDQIP